MEWESFLEINDSPKASPTLLWETGEAVLQGNIISFSVPKKRGGTGSKTETENLRIREL